MRSRRVSCYAQEQIEAVVDTVIAEHGFKFAIPWLLKTVSDLAASAYKDPGDAAKARKHAQWSQALQAVLQRAETLKRPFEQRVSGADAFWARRMGIRLD